MCRCEKGTDFINGKDTYDCIHNIYNIGCYDIGCCDNPIVNVLELIKYLMSINAL